MGRLNPTTDFDQFDNLPIQCNHIEHMREEVWFKIKIDKIIAMRILTIIPYRAFIFA